MKTKKILTVGLLLASGAASADTPEAVWQSLHLLDIAQTFHGAASDRCYREGDPLTRSLIGSHPTHSGVVAWGLGYSLGHYFLSEFLRDNAPHWTYLAWQAVSISYAGYSIGHNYSIGIRLGRPNTDYLECPLWARP